MSPVSDTRTVCDTSEQSPIPSNSLNNSPANSLDDNNNYNNNDNNNNDNDNDNNNNNAHRDNIMAYRIANNKFRAYLKAFFGLAGLYFSFIKEVSSLKEGEPFVAHIDSYYFENNVSSAADDPEKKRINPVFTRIDLS